MRLANCTCAAVEEYLKRSKTIVIAVGSTENHGKHMPLGTDTMIPDKIVELLEKKSGVMIAPTIPYGAADSLVGFTGTISLGIDGLLLVLTRVTDCLYDYGFRRFVIVNGHGGNIKPIEALGERLYARGAYVANLNWWLMAGELRPEWDGGHGGAEETAGVMAVDPSLIDYSHINDPLIYTNDIDESMPTTGWDKVAFKGASVVIPRPAMRYNKNGWLGSDKPEKATPEWGREMVETMADYVADFVEAFEKVALPAAKMNEREKKAK